MTGVCARNASGAAAALGLVAGLLLPAGGCSRYHRFVADREAYAIIRAKTPDVPGMPADFRLGDAGAPLPEHPIMEALREGKPCPPIGLADALTLAATYSREFQDQREAVFLEALALSRTRHQFSPLFSWAFSASQQDARGVRSRTGTSDFGVSQALATGADLSVSLSTTLFKFLSPDPQKSAESLLEFSMRQPLWRGAGRRVAQENLTQAERDMLYALREFARFRRRFTVSVATEYFRVLQQQDTVENELANLRNLTLARERAQMLAQAGRQPEFQVDQAEQDELRAKDRWVRARQQYEALLDQFKITLGLPATVPITLDRGQLDRLRTEELPPPPLTHDEAVRRAMRFRLDLATALDEVEDAGRKAEVTRDNLAPDLDIVLRSATASEPPTKPLKLKKTLTTRSAGVELDLPLDRLSQRNDYRAALIALDRSVRGFTLLRDQIVLQINSAWRALEEARESYLIQRRSIELAERRVESTGLLIDAGRADMRDLLEAQDALLQARNTLTRALVDYHIAMMELWRDMDTLAVADGQVMEQVPDEGGETEDE